jgi:hypothetical protein
VDPIGRTIEMLDWGSPYRATVIDIVGDCAVHRGGDPARGGRCHRRTGRRALRVDPIAALRAE